MKRKIAFLFALLLVSQATLSCADSTTTKPPTGSTSTSTSIPTTDTDGPTEETRLYPDLPEMDYEKEEIQIYIAYNTDGSSFHGVPKNEFAATEENADPINDARYRRTLAVEEKFNVKISNLDFNEKYNTNYASGAVPTVINKLVSSGTNEYAFMLLPGLATASLATNHVLQDLWEMEYLGLNEPWWDQRANAELTVMDRLFFTAGDILTADNDATCVVLFNKLLASQFDLPDLYQMVEDGTWTFDAMYALCDEIANDLNGDLVYDENDRYGALLWDDIAVGVVNAVGERCAVVDDDGYLSLTINNERVIDALTKYAEFGRDKTKSFQYQRVSPGDELAIDMFVNNQSLFLLQLMQIVPGLRNMETDFGILPMPKHDEAQSSYYHTVGQYHSVFFCMPDSNVDSEMSSIIAQALACEGKYTVNKAYYDVNLKGKGVRDEESSAMLDLIFDTRVFDIGWYYAYSGEVMDLVRLNRQQRPIASMFEESRKSVEKAFKEVNEAYEEYGQ